MKKRLIAATVVLVMLIAVGCSFITDSQNRNIIAGTFTVGTGIDSRDVQMRSLVTDSQAGNIDKLWLRAFKTTGEQIPAVGVTGTDGAAVLTWDAGSERWLGSMELDLTGYSGQLFFHAMAFDSRGEIVHQGTTSATSEFGSSPITITTQAGYDDGDRGPSGGWVIYDKESFSSDTDMDKTWRYMEISPYDISNTWSGIELDNSTHELDADGNVVLKGTSTIDMSVYDWYWGVNGNHSTVVTLLKGKPNTEVLDAMSSATPKKVKVNGRAALKETAQTRRDTADYLLSAPISAYSDWFIPSKEEMERVITVNNLPAAAGGSRSAWNIEEQRYWTSTEDPQSMVDPDDEIYAWAVDMDSAVLTENAPVSAERYNTYRVRPVRVF